MKPGDYAAGVVRNSFVPDVNDGDGMEIVPAQGTHGSYRGNGAPIGKL